MHTSLWEKEFDEYYRGEVDEKRIEAVQEELNVVLPISYVDLMKQRNGFYLKKKILSCYGTE